MFIEALVESTTDELILETEEYGFIAMGVFQHEHQEGDLLELDVIETSSVAGTQGYQHAASFQTLNSEPKNLRVKILPR